MHLIAPWKLRLLRQTLKSAVPFQQHLRRLKRRLDPYQSNPGNDSFALQQGLQQIRLLRECGANLQGTVLEIGTGWMPTIPLLFHIAGARHLHLTDVEELIDAHTIKASMAFVRTHTKRISTELEMDETQVLDRIESFPSSFDYHCPADLDSFAQGPSTS